MIDVLYTMIQQYGLWAIFAGCVAEGESAAVIAGFLAHQHVFPLPEAALATFSGAFLGDSLMFLAGRRFAHHRHVQRMTQKPGFARALALVDRNPTIYVMLNRYVYGFRAIGGVAAGLSTIPTHLFLIINAISAAIWAAIFVAIGYFLGAGAEQVIGAELSKHQRLLTVLAIGVVATMILTIFMRRQRRSHDPQNPLD